MAVTDRHGAQYTTSAHFSEVKGRMATLKNSGIVEDKTVSVLATMGRDGPTLAEKNKAGVLLRIFQEASTVTQNPFSRLIWPDGSAIEWPEALLVLEDTPAITYDFPLNDSQIGVVQNMLSLSNSTRITMAQGPPGTGKTTVIGAFVQSATAAGLDGIWLVAQSNVAVKNIAEKLLKIGFTEWKVLVSLDFHDGWFVFSFNFLPFIEIILTGMNISTRHFRSMSFVLMSFAMPLVKFRDARFFYALSACCPTSAWVYSQPKSLSKHWS